MMQKKEAKGKASSNVRVIKRYSNRRLYDSTDKRTITHKDLKQLLAAGESIQIIENKSGRDVTVESLSRMLAGESPSWSNNQNQLRNLSELITEGGTLSMSILRNTILASIGVFNLTKKKAEEVVDQLIKSGDLTKSQRKEAVMELLDKADKSTEEFREKVTKQASKVGTEVQAAVEKLKVAKKNDLDALNKKVDKLIRSMAKLDKKISKL